MRFSKKSVRTFVVAMIFAMIFSSAAFAAGKTAYLTSKNWEPNTKKVINQMFDMFGKNSKGYDPNNKPYAVFDFDNAISINDIGQQAYFYMFERLRFAAKPERMYTLLTTGIPDVNKDLGEKWGHLTVAKVARDAAKAYAKLYAKGYVAPDNSKESRMKEWINSDDWKEFATKVWWLHDAIVSSYSTQIGYPWTSYLFEGMTPAQVQQLGEESHRYSHEKQLNDPTEWKKVTWQSPDSKKYPSEAGQLTIKRSNAVTVTPEMQELLACLDENGIDVWFCSASYLDIIKAAIPAWNLKGVEGVTAMTNKTKDGVLTNEYDFDLHPQTEGPGKVATVDKIIRPLYKGRGPIFGVGDSQGDFNFQTEYKDMKVVLIVNRIRSDDEGLGAACAVFQNKKGIDLPAAMKQGEIRFCLQGRNENGGWFWPTTATMSVGKTEPGNLSSKAQGWVEMMEKGTPVKDMINNCVKLTGKQKEYYGYKKR
ncbi:MAG: hypothetical protein Q4E34_00410 [Synergistaceae bacterium]|nr:hypothetical protein [Synergistaceae bacterium]